MTRYEWQHFRLDDDRGFDTKDRVVHVLDAPSAHETGTYALVEVSETEQDITATFTEDSQRVADGGDNYPTCAGKGGECSRSVDAEGDFCWQHD